jgi:hypothetical protein
MQTTGLLVRTVGGPPQDGVYSQCDVHLQFIGTLTTKCVDTMLPAIDKGLEEAEISFLDFQTKCSFSRAFQVMRKPPLWIDDWLKWATRLSFEGYSYVLDVYDGDDN